MVLKEDNTVIDFEKPTDQIDIRELFIRYHAMYSCYRNRIHNLTTVDVASWPVGRNHE